MWLISQLLDWQLVEGVTELEVQMFAILACTAAFNEFSRRQEKTPRV